MYRFHEESGDQQDSCEVFRNSLGTSRMAVKYIGRVLGQAGWLRISKTSLGTSRIAVKSIGRVWIPAG